MTLCRAFLLTHVQLSAENDVYEEELRDNVRAGWVDKMQNAMKDTIQTYRCLRDVYFLVPKSECVAVGLTPFSTGLFWIIDPKPPRRVGEYIFLEFSFGCNGRCRIILNSYASNFVGSIQDDNRKCLQRTRTSDDDSLDT